MNTQISIWLCVAITLFIFVIDYLFVSKLKRSVIEKIEWNSEE